MGIAPAHSPRDERDGGGRVAGCRPIERSTPPRLHWAGMVVVALLGCQPPTQVTIELSTDIDCASYQGATITVGAKGDVETNPPATVADECNVATGRIGSVVVVPSDADDDPIAIKIVAGRGWRPEACTPANNYGDDAPVGNGCVVARRFLRYVPSTPLVLPIELRDACVGEPCSPEETCVKGICMPAEIGDSNVCASPGGCSPDALYPSVPDDPR